MSNGTLQSAGMSTTPKPPGRIAAALEPMQSLTHDLASIERRICKVLDKFIGTEPEEAAKDILSDTPTEDTLEIHIRDLAHSYYAALERVHHQVDRLERL